MSRTNETRHTEWHENFKCKCRLDWSICNDKQHWNNDKCRCECKELIDKSRCDKGFIWNPSICECGCDKSSDGGEYLDYENFSCRKRLIDRLNEKCSEDINRNEMVYNVTFHGHRKVCHCFTIYLVKYTLLYTTYISHCYFNNHRH